MDFLHEGRHSNAQAVVVSDPNLIAEVLGKDTEIGKSIESVYSKFNVVSATA